ncbi:hypothetical protein ACWT_5400 [Actinoplanes sp. SE50]|nr:hypothetical protein ACPL_5531 [Actinoplanes sp. SE50/110]ATO84815.1 hypothetical protein ACWT_5400 [Actinoplanes sp. SE50]SLM02225.1 hypothetical protein ACSP50_5463 [Actinoplanes sp. SE50/110]
MDLSGKVTGFALPDLEHSVREKILLRNTARSFFEGDVS